MTYCMCRCNVRSLEISKLTVSLSMSPKDHLCKLADLEEFGLNYFMSGPCKHDNGYMDGRS